MGIIFGPIVLVVAGMVFLVARRKMATRTLAIMAAVTGALVFLVLIGLRHERHGETGPWAVIPVLIYTIILSAFVACILVLVWRLCAWMGAADPAGAAVNPEERKRILAMVEQGKMTGEEGAELLDALGKSSALRGQQTFGRLDVAILIGVAVTVFGFFLPWGYINIASLNYMSQALVAGEMYQAGYHTGAIGWAVLISAILAALLVFITPKEYLYKLVLLQVLSICTGMAIVMSVWWRVGTEVGAGVIICLLGFGLALVASGMKLKALGR